MRIKTIFNVIRRIAASGITLGSALMLVYGIATFKIELIIAAPIVYFLIGGLSMQIINDVEDGFENW